MKLARLAWSVRRATAGAVCEIPLRPTIQLRRWSQGCGPSAANGSAAAVGAGRRRDSIQLATRDFPARTQ
jgi:hypothetical protein